MVIPETMKAAVLHEHRSRLSVEQVPTPSPGDDDVLVKVIACGVCHSDLHAVDGDWTPGSVIPLIPGHEVTGTVVAAGADVDPTIVGSLVGVPWMYSSCGVCEWCLAGMETICPRGEATGYSVAGGYAEFMVAPAAFVVALPADVDPVALAPVLCAGVTTYRGLKRTAARPGQWVAIVGIGGLGHLAVQYARAMGLRVAAVDVAADKLELARSLGAELIIDASATDPVAEVRARTGGVHAAVVAAVASRAFEQALGMLRPAGTAVYLGIPGGAADEIKVSISSIVNAELSMRGSNVGTRLDVREAVDLAVRGKVSAVVRAVPLDQVNDVLDDMRAGVIVGRVVLTT